MEGPVFSIIVPIYNSEKTLNMCLDSILNQKLSEYEVLMIDDGSTDCSKQICEQYLKQDNRYKYYYKNNSGPSDARNKGLDLAIGEYIAFVDSDDYISVNYLERILDAFNQKNADVVFMSYKLIGKDERCVQLPLLGELYYNNLMTLSNADMFGYTWIKAFRREIIKDVRFNSSFRILEDEMFTCEILEQKCRIAIVSEPIYSYYRGDDSLAKKAHNNYCEACDRVYQLWKRLLNNCDDNRKLLFLNEKANHFSNNCKYYGLEKNVKTIDFYKKLSECEFFKESTIYDTLLNSVKKKNWLKVQLLCAEYMIKNKIKLLLEQ